MRSAFMEPTPRIVRQCFDLDRPKSLTYSRVCHQIEKPNIGPASLWGWFPFGVQKRSIWWFPQKKADKQIAGNGKTKRKLTCESGIWNPLGWVHRKRDVPIWQSHILGQQNEPYSWRKPDSRNINHKSSALTPLEILAQFLKG